METTAISLLIISSSQEPFQDVCGDCPSQLEPFKQNYDLEVADCLDNLIQHDTLDITLLFPSSCKC